RADLWSNSEPRNCRSVEPAKRNAGLGRVAGVSIVPALRRRGLRLRPSMQPRGQMILALKWTSGPDICGQKLDRPRVRALCVGCVFGSDRGERVDTCLGAAVMLG